MINFSKGHRREPTEPQLATMIDVFSILIIFLIAGTAMDSSVLNIPTDIFLPATSSKLSSVNAPQVTLKNGNVEIVFLNDKVSIADINLNDSSSLKMKSLETKFNNYLKKINEANKNKKGELQLLQSINLVADRNIPYSQLFTTIKFFRKYGFQSTILVGVENNEKSK